MNESGLKEADLQTPSTYSIGLLLAAILYIAGVIALFKGLYTYQEMYGSRYGRGFADPTMMLLMFTPGLASIAFGGVIHLLSAIVKNTAHLVQLRISGRE